MMNPQEIVTSEFRIVQHPILPIRPLETFVFYWQGRPMAARQGEAIASALFDNGIRILGYHPKDGSPQGIFCANGQCAQCMVLVNDRPVKACVEPAQPGMRVAPLRGLPVLPEARSAPTLRDCAREIAQVTVPVLIVGGGPAGLSAAIELGRLGIETLLVDDKHALGGKLVLQTHRFFGSAEAVYAGMRGVDIAARLAATVGALHSVQVWLNSTVLAVFSDHKVGILRDGKDYTLVEPRALLVATGARERSLIFRGNTLPGVYGAGAFQTLVNRDLVRPAERLFIVGGGNVGLIAGYHALQAGIAVVGLAEAMPECTGYKVHRDKLARLGVPIHTSQTILGANGTDGVESVTIAQVNAQLEPVPGTERSFECDTVLVAVGLEPVNEFYRKAQEFGLAAFVAGDAEEIAEASAAMFTGRIRGCEIARALGCQDEGVPADWRRMAEILKSRPGRTAQEPPSGRYTGVLPILHCTQEIPCNPRAAICPQQLIHIDENDPRQLPTFLGKRAGKTCIGCERCVVVCPGLAIVLVDYRQNAEFPTVSLPYEFDRGTLSEGEVVTATDTAGHVLGHVQVTSIYTSKANDRTWVIRVQVPARYAERIAAVRVQECRTVEPMPQPVQRISDDDILCRCERVTAGEIRELVRQGYRDMNEIKAVTRAGMGACGGKTCLPLIRHLFRMEGISPDQVTDHVQRPLFAEVPLGLFAGIEGADVD